MIDIEKIKYYYVVHTVKKETLDITNFVQNGGWEEGNGELATRITAKVFNGKLNGKSLSTQVKNGCLIRVLVATGGKKREVARGIITDWEPSLTGQKNNFELTAYDNLYNLQESSDNLYFTEGTSTKAVLTSIFSSYKIPTVAKYSGPNISHAKLVFKNKKVSDMILEVLDEAHTKGSKKYVLRSISGKIRVIQRGSNKNVYYFSKDETQVVKYKQSTAGITTRVKVIGQSKEDDSATIAIVDGKTQYGIRQQIYTKPKDDSDEAAKKEAEKILKEKGSVKKTMTVEGPDVPYIRRWDKVYVHAGAIKGYCYVIGIRHYVDNAKMQMELEYV